MIQSFRCKDAEKLNAGKSTRRFQPFENVARRKLKLLSAAVEVRDLQVPPGNRLARGAAG